MFDTTTAAATTAAALELAAEKVGSMLDTDPAALLAEVQGLAFLASMRWGTDDTESAFLFSQDWRAKAPGVGWGSAQTDATAEELVWFADYAANSVNVTTTAGAALVCALAALVDWNHGMGWTGVTTYSVDWFSLAARALDHLAGKSVRSLDTLVDHMFNNVQSMQASNWGGVTPNDIETGRKKASAVSLVWATAANTAEERAALT